ncbi:stage II sporulation protein M [Gayadomonas joobiniege]|uniref:stage II sporulation protein M n=1 Tax=Gayadomonas joobiniege TaxID=1234606 RepID=UPI000360F559|nr:stage II sporulation protein M [Gayadomonas joobiniege]
MKQTQFISIRQAHWQKLEAFFNGEASAEKLDLPALLRAVTHDLAVAKSRGYSPAIIDRLNTLITSAQAHMYRPKQRIGYQLIRFLRLGFPLSVQNLKQACVINHILFYGFALLAAGLVAYQPQMIYSFVDNAQLRTMEHMYNPDANWRQIERASSGDFQMFGFYIFNNIKIAFQTFAGGLLLGVGALFYLLFNGFYFGALSAHMVNIGYQSTFFSFVITHGAFELTAIVLSAAAGTHIGYSLLNPGRLSRHIAVKQAALRAFPVLLGAFVFLVIAAFIEAFWSSSQALPQGVKYAVGTLCWIGVAIYFCRGLKYATR